MKNNVYPFKPQFNYTKVGFKGVEIIKACFRDAVLSVRRRFHWPLSVPCNFRLVPREGCAS